jgi:hypothetical protein
VAEIFLDVEAGDNCPYSMQLMFSGLEEPRPIRQVKLYLKPGPGELFDITGWDGDGPCDAVSIVVEDSGQARAFLIMGGNGGLRFRPPGQPEWDLTASDQWGESHLLLTDPEDIVWVK